MGYRDRDTPKRIALVHHSFQKWGTYKILSLLNAKLLQACIDDLENRYFEAIEEQERWT